MFKIPFLCHLLENYKFVIKSEKIAVCNKQKSFRVLEQTV